MALILLLPVYIIHKKIHPNKAKKIYMSWAHWPELVFQHQIRLVGWPAEIRKIPGPRFNYKVDIKPRVLARLVLACIQALLGETKGEDGSSWHVKPWMDAKAPTL